MMISWQPDSSARGRPAAVDAYEYDAVVGVRGIPAFRSSIRPSALQKRMNSALRGSAP